MKIMKERVGMMKRTFVFLLVCFSWISCSVAQPLWSEYQPTPLADYSELLSEQAQLVGLCPQGFSRLAGLSEKGFPSMFDTLSGEVSYTNAYKVRRELGAPCAGEQWDFVKLTGPSGASVCLEARNYVDADQLSPPFGQGPAAPNECYRAHTNFYLCCDN